MIVQPGLNGMVVDSVINTGTVIDAAVANDDDDDDFGLVKQEFDHQSAGPNVIGNAEDQFQRLRLNASKARPLTPTRSHHMLATVGRRKKHGPSMVD